MREVLAYNEMSNLMIQLCVCVGGGGGGGGLLFMLLNTTFKNISIFLMAKPGVSTKNH